MKLMGRLFRSSLLHLSLLTLPGLFAIRNATAGEDQRTWEQVTTHFIKPLGPIPYQPQADGERLKELNPGKATDFLIPFLAQNQPPDVRLRAMEAIGYAQITNAIPTLCAIALDANESENIRYNALSPGLRRMKDRKIAKTARFLANDSSANLRKGAYLVLGSQQTEECLHDLGACLRTATGDERNIIIYSIMSSRRPGNDQLIFTLCPKVDLTDIEFVCAYTMALSKGSVPEAQDVLLRMLTIDDARIRWNLLRYFQHYPRPEVVPGLLEFVEHRRCSGKEELEIYPLLWSFYTSPKIPDETKSQIRPWLAELNRDIDQFVRRAQMPEGRLDRAAELANIYETVFRRMHDCNADSSFGPLFLEIEGKDPAPEFMARFRTCKIPIKRQSDLNGGDGIIHRVESCLWIDDNQVIVSGGYYAGDMAASGELYLVVRKDGRWSVIHIQKLWIS